MKKLMIASILCYIYDVSMITYNYYHHEGDNILVLPTIPFVYSIISVLLVEYKKWSYTNPFIAFWVLLPCIAFILINIIIILISLGASIYS
jgi:hypothetical protein